MSIPRFCLFSLPAETRGRELFTDCVKSPFHDGRHVVGASARISATLHEVDEEAQTLVMLLHARLNPGKGLSREEMGALLIYTDLLKEE